jgi:hypothetical protein
VGCRSGRSSGTGRWRAPGRDSAAPSGGTQVSSDRRAPTGDRSDAGASVTPRRAGAQPGEQGGCAGVRHGSWLVGGRARGAAGQPAGTLPQACGGDQPCQRERTGLAKLFTMPSAPIAHSGPHTDGNVNHSVSQPSRSGQTASTSQEACPRCGGSGQLRTGHGAYRTCLHCAGRGSTISIGDQGAKLQGNLPARAMART